MQKVFLFDRLRLMLFKIKSMYSFSVKLLLVLILIQCYFPSHIFCMESDGSTFIETSISGFCFDNIQNCHQDYRDGILCKNCTDIPLNQELSLSRFDSDDASIKVLRPSYFSLYASGFKPYLSDLSLEHEASISKECSFVYHPHQLLKSTILLI